MRKHPQSIHDFICSQKRFRKDAMPVQKKSRTDASREQIRVHSFKNRVRRIERHDLEDVRRARRS